LYLDGNQVADLSPFVEMWKPDLERPAALVPFRTLSVTRNPLTDAARNQQVAALRKVPSALVLTE
jgi:hypothetical protein